jgi:hypothetical protein
MFFSARLCELMLKFRVKFTLENPSSSRLWLCKPFLKLLKRKPTHFSITEFCMWGTDGRKATGFLSAFVDLSFMNDFRCLGAKRGLCKRSGKPHHVLSGTNREGVFWTGAAEPYPPALCSRIASS